jgi:hypothetical protein
MSPSVVTQKIVLMLVLLALGLGIWLTQARFRAAVLFEQSQTLQDAWIESPASLTAEDWQTAAEDLLAATRIDDHAEYYHRYGMLLDAQRTLLGEDITAEQLEQILGTAIEAHRLGVKQQPAHPIGWARFARAKALASQLDGEFDLALERLYTLGPWNRENQFFVAQMAQYFWPAFSEYGRYYVVNMLQLALSHPGNDTPVLNLLRDGELLPDPLCPLLYLPDLTDAAQAACQPQQ